MACLWSHTGGERLQNTPAGSPSWEVCYLKEIWYAQIILFSGLNNFVLFCLFFVVVLFCMAALIFPVGFYINQVGGQPYKLPNNTVVGSSYVLFVLSIFFTIVGLLFAGKVCLPGWHPLVFNFFFYATDLTFSMPVWFKWWPRKIIIIKIQTLQREDSLTQKGIFAVEMLL